MAKRAKITWTDEERRAFIEALHDNEAGTMRGKDLVALSDMLQEHLFPPERRRNLSAALVRDFSEAPVPVPKVTDSPPIPEVVTPKIEDRLNGLGGSIDKLRERIRMSEDRIQELENARAGVLSMDTLLRGLRMVTEVIKEHTLEKGNANGRGD